MEGKKKTEVLVKKPFEQTMTYCLAKELKFDRIVIKLQINFTLIPNPT